MVAPETQIKTWVDIASIAVSVFTTLSIIAGAVLYFVNNSRDRRIKTLEYWEEAQPKLLAAHNQLSTINASCVWTEELATRHLENTVNHQKIFDGISTFERLALGINLKTYDVKVISSVAGVMLMESYLTYLPLIETYQALYNKPLAFSEFRKLYLTLNRYKK